MSKSRDELNTVQAKHHQLVPVWAIEEALKENRDIGYNDIAAFVCKKIDAYAAPAIAHALKYQTRIGAKDDNRQEIEKAIWYLMDAHNRFSDLEGDPRDFAPWRHLGKLSELEELGFDKELNSMLVEVPESETSTPQPQPGYWRKIEDPYTVDYYLDPDLFKHGDWVKFSEGNARIEKNKKYRVVAKREEGDFELPYTYYLEIFDDCNNYYYFGGSSSSAGDLYKWEENYPF